MSKAYCGICHKSVDAIRGDPKTSGYAIYDNGGPLDIAFPITGQAQFYCPVCRGEVTTEIQGSRMDTQALVCDFLFWLVSIPYLIFIAAAVFSAPDIAIDPIELGIILVVSVYAAAFFHGNHQLWSTLMMFLISCFLVAAFMRYENVEKEKSDQRRREVVEGARNYELWEKEHAKDNAYKDETLNSASSLSPVSNGASTTENSSDLIQPSTNEDANDTNHSYRLSVPDSKREALSRYPELGIAGSAFNSEFLRIYKLYQATHPEYFADSQWPLNLAAEVSATLKSQNRN